MASLRAEIEDLRRSQGSLHQATSSTHTNTTLTPTVPSVTTVLAYPSKSDAPIILRWSSSEIELFHTFCLNHRIMQLQPTEAWQILTHSFPPSTLETLRGIINMHRSEQRLPRVPYKTLSIQEVINMLRSVAHTLRTKNLLSTRKILSKVT